VSAVALHYERKTEQHHVALTVPQGEVTRVHLPDEDAKAHLVTAVLKARTQPEEDLELFGRRATELEPRERRKLRARVGAVSPVVGLIHNLNTWENISLPAAYHRTAPLEDVATLAHEVIGAFGGEPQVFLACVPDELSMLERKVAAFIRLLVSAPELMVFDALEEGLSHSECKRVARFETVYRAYQPAGTVLYVDTREDKRDDS
jgi:ABC-type transporter Mla maintaining outer membrane lipid asymmetry ATPase subunit MlaF